MEFLPDLHLKKLIESAKQARALNSQLRSAEKPALSHDAQQKLILASLKNVQLIATALLKSTRHTTDTPPEG